MTEPKRIKLLAPEVANQIAAGEVIERPASIIKELLENSVDASASNITIEVDYGGINRIKVIDDGFGIYAEDLNLAVTAHATSKLSELQDLYGLYSMGFRGEALASMAAISKFSIISKPKAQEHAVMISNETGSFILKPYARIEGTTVEIKNLFYNVPVRKAFLKSAQIEFLAIEQVVKRFALAHSQIAVTLIHNDKKILSLPAAISEANKIMRLQKIMGKNFYENSIYLEASSYEISLHGWISNSDYQISQSDKIWFYINQRMVKDKLLNHALKIAYESILHPGRFPTCLLYLKIPPSEIDVNVHPTKNEVRFKDPRIIHDFIFSEIQKNILRKPETVKTASIPNQIKYQKEPDKFTLQQEMIILNSQFLIIYIDNLPHMINYFLVEAERLNNLIEKSKPLLCRPLLVPIQLEISKNQSVKLENIQENLNNFGIQFNWFSENKIIIRTIPTLLPQLQIKDFFNEIIQTNINNDNEIQKLLLKHYSFDANYLSEEDKLQIKEYIKNKIEFKKGEKISLDTESCRRLIYA